MHAIYYNDTDVNPAWSVKEKNLNSREYDRSSSYRPLAQLPLSYGLRKQKWQGFRLLNARLSHHGCGRLGMNLPLQFSVHKSKPYRFGTCTLIARAE